MLEERNIRYAVLRDRDIGNPELSELDILIHPDDFHRFHDLAQEMGFVGRNYRIPGKRIYLRWDNEKMRILDVHLAMIQKGIIYLPYRPVLQRCTKNEHGFYQLSPEDELLHLFFHNLIGKKILQEKHLQRIRDLLAKNPDLQFSRSQIRTDTVRKIFDDFIREPRDFAVNPAIASRASRAIIHDYTHQSPRNYINFFIRQKLRKYMARHYGIHVAFLGVDGAGKTTTIEAVRNSLAQIGKIKFNLIYMGPWGQIRSPFLRFVYNHDFFPPKEDWLQRFREGVKRKSLSAALISFRKFLFGKLKGWLYYAAVYSEMWFRYLKEVRAGIRKNRIVLEDRYVYDLRYIYKKRPMRQFRFWRWFICQFFPEPDLTVFLFNDPEKIASRKPQLQPQEIREFQKFYRKALEGKRTLSVKTDDEPTEIARQIIDHIMEIYLKKHQ